jgi:molybdate transport system substrate-binding protein
VLVLAAASVGDAVEEVAREFTASTGIEVRVSAAGSNVLAQQIRAGAPGDLFLSADEAWADEVIQSGEGTEKVDLLGNALVLVVPMGNPARIRVPHDLAQKHVTKIALAGEAVPAGRYAQQALRSIGMWPVVERKVVRSENVRAALAYVESGEADAGVVYATDAHSTAKVTVVYKFTPATHDPIVYPLVTLKAGANREAVRDFRRYLQGLEAGAIFSRLGFRVLPHDLPSDAPPGGNEP